MSPVLGANSYMNEVEADVRFKKSLPIYLQHDFGDVTIQGWSQDLIRVRLKKTVTADSQEIATENATRFNLVSLETPKAIELRVGTPLGTDLLTKLRNRQKKKDVRVDLEIKAPLNLGLTLVLGAGKKLSLNQWKGEVRINGSNGRIELSKLKLNQTLSVHCPDCAISVVDSEFSGSILGGNQKIDFQKVKATSKPLMVFSRNGEIALAETEGEIQVRSEAGSISGKNHRGDLHVQTDSGSISLDAMSGEIDAQTISGAIRCDLQKPGDLIEMKSKDGAIAISVPADFNGALDLQSVQGTVDSEFLIKEKKNRMDEYGPSIKGKVLGVVGGRESPMITAVSETGGIRIGRRRSQK
jgi:hypothetical protein